MIFGRHPAAIAGAIRAVLLAFMAFGLKMQPEQLAAVMLAVEAVLTLFVHQNVTPLAAPKLALGTPVLVDRPEGYPEDQPPPDAVVQLRQP